jgi:hypothetical protein
MGMFFNSEYLTSKWLGDVMGYQSPPEATATLGLMYIEYEYIFTLGGTPSTPWIGWREY